MGLFEFAGLSAGPYRLQAEVRTPAGGKLLYLERSIAVPEGDFWELDLNLDAIRILGNIRLEDRNPGWPHVEIHYQDPGGYFSDSAGCDEEGNVAGAEVDGRLVPWIAALPRVLPQSA